MSMCTILRGASSAATSSRPSDGAAAHERLPAVPSSAAPLKPPPGTSAGRPPAPKALRTLRDRSHDADGDVPPSRLL